MMKLTSRSARTLAGLAACGILAGTLVSCSSSSEPSDSAAPPADCTPATAGLTTVKEGALTVGVPENFPYSETVGTDDAVGMDVDILRKVAELECLTPVFVPSSYANGVPMIAEQKSIDIAVSGWYPTEERAKKVDFTSPVFYDSFAIISEDGLTEVSSLEGAGQTGVVAGHAWEEDMTKVLGGEINSYPSPIEIKQDLIAGRLVAGLESYAVAKTVYADTDFTVEIAQPDDRVKVTTDPPVTAFPMSKENPDLTAAVTKHIDAFRADGTLAEIVQAYDLSPDIVVNAERAARKN